MSNNLRALRNSGCVWSVPHHRSKNNGFRLVEEVEVEAEVEVEVEDPGLSRRVYGGCWRDSPMPLRNPVCGWSVPDYRSKYTSFRLVEEIETEPGPEPVPEDPDLSHRKIYGGCWYYPVSYLETSNHSEGSLSNRTIHIGFRLVEEVEGTLVPTRSMDCTHCVDSKLK
jgi:hypothetical protein